MSKYYCNEDARNLVELEIQNRKDALKLYDGIIEVVKKFDGKVLNKRFDTALKQFDGRLSYNREYSWFEINMNVFDNRSCKSVKKDAYGYSCTNYITDSYLRLNNLVYTYSNNSNDKVMLDNERIISSVLIEALNKGKEQMQNKINELENSIDKVDEWKTKLEALKHEMENIMGEVPYIIREYYDINYRVENR